MVPKVPIDTGGESQPHVKIMALLIQDQFDVDNIGGFASTGHITNSDHYKGLALDVMVGSNKAKGNAVATWAIGQSPVTYVIWNRRWYDRRNNKGWQRYTGTSPHTDHVHISFRPATKQEQGILTPGGDPLIPGIPNPLADLMDTLRESGIRVAAFVGGLALVLISVILWRRSNT